MSYGRCYPRAYPAELRRQPAPTARPYEPSPAVHVTRIGLLVRVRWAGVDVRHRYPNKFQAKRMAAVLRTSSAARRRFLAKFGGGR